MPAFASSRTLALCLAAVSLAGRAGADCTPRTHASTCFDADPLWVPAAPSKFVAIPAATALRAGTLAAGLDLSYASHPVTLVAASPDPSGRDVHVIDQLLDGAASAAASPFPHLEASVTLPFVAMRSGTGLGGVTSQGESSLSAAALRDVRLGLGQDLTLGRPASGTEPRVMSRLEAALPTGGAFAGSRGVTVAPSFGVELRSAPVFFGAQLGARFRPVSEIGGARLGSELVVGLGAGMDVMEREKLSLAVEGFALPSLVSQRQALPDGTTTEGTLVPSEWIFSARTRFGPIRLQLGLGTAIPLSGASERHPDGTVSTEHFAAITSPEYRITLAVRYVTSPG